VRKGHSFDLPGPSPVRRGESFRLALTPFSLWEKGKGDEVKRKKRENMNLSTGLIRLQRIKNAKLADARLLRRKMKKVFKARGVLTYRIKNNEIENNLSVVLLGVRNVCELRSTIL
jgi:hypothetical protein